jgi:chromosome segregation ATPase
MTQIIQWPGALVLVIAILSAAGCQGNSKDRDAKRESDRTMMRLQDADRERTELKSQIEQLKASLDTAVVRSRDTQNDLSATQTQLRQAQDELAKSRANTVSSAKLSDEVASLHAQNKELQARLSSTMQQLQEAKAAAANRMPTVSTQPSLNK